MPLPRVSLVGGQVLMLAGTCVPPPSLLQLWGPLLVAVFAAALYLFPARTCLGVLHLMGPVSPFLRPPSRVAFLTAPTQVPAAQAISGAQFWEGWAATFKVREAAWTGLACMVW